MDFEVIAEGYQFVEAPRVAADGSVYFSDLTGGGYYRARSGGAVETVVPDRMWIGGATLDQGGAMVLGGKGGLVLVEPHGEVRPLLTEVGGRPIVGANDMEADPTGGLFGSTIDFVTVFEKGEIPIGGQFFHLSPSGEVRIIRDDMAASNGLGYSPDGRLLYHSESTVGVWVWQLGEDGMPASRELFAKIEDCDGLAVDAEGGVWVACWATGRLLRYRADGVLDKELKPPFPHIVSVDFGGPDLTHLYVATGGNAEHPGKGGIIRIRTDVPGLKTNRTRFAK